MDDQLESVAQIKNTLIDLAIRFGPKVLAALLILALGLFVGRWIGLALEQMLKKLHLEAPIRLLLVRIVRVLVLGLFVIMALQNLGVELLPLIAGIGIAGAGVALAMQGVLSNVAVGLTIIFTRPFRVGEYVSMVGEEGRLPRSVCSTLRSITRTYRAWSFPTARSWGRSCTTMEISVRSTS